MKYIDDRKVGRPKGVLTENVKLRIRAQADFRNKASKIANKLLMAQTQEALGTYKIVRKDEIYNNKGKMVSIKWEVVEDKREIEKVMNNFQDISGEGEIDGKYYMIVRDKPDHRAANSILDRSWGKPSEYIKLAGDKDEPITIDYRLSGALKKAYGNSGEGK